MTSSMINIQSLYNESKSNSSLLFDIINHLKCNNQVNESNPNVNESNPNVNESNQRILSLTINDIITLYKTSNVNQLHLLLTLLTSDDDALINLITKAKGDKVIRVIVDYMSEFNDYKSQCIEITRVFDVIIK